MKKILLFMLLFVNLQIVIKEHAFMFKAGADVMAQIMSAERYTCYDEVNGDWYYSSLQCEYDKPKTAKRKPRTSIVGGGGGGSVEFVQEPNTDEETDDDDSTDETNTETTKVDEDGTIVRIISLPGNQVKPVVGSVKWPDDKIPTIVIDVPEHVPVDKIGAIIAALPYRDGNYRRYLRMVRDAGYTLMDDLLKEAGIITHDPITGLDVTLLLNREGAFVLAFAGTDINQIGDLQADLWQTFYGMGRPNPRGTGILYPTVDDIKDYSRASIYGQYAAALCIAQQVLRLVGNADISFVGHSLGGGLAAMCGMAFDKYAITYNAASLNLRTLKWLSENGYGISSDHTYRYIASGDILNFANDAFIGKSQGHRIEVIGAPAFTHSIDDVINVFK